MRTLWAILTIPVLLTPTGSGALCSIDPTSPTLQAGAAAGDLGYPTFDSESCGPPDQEESETAGPIGNSYWEGTGRSAVVDGVPVNEMQHYRRTGTGSWGWGPDMQGSFFIPDLVISGGPGPTVDVLVNVASQVSGFGDAMYPSQQNVNWRAQLRTPAGANIGNVVIIHPWEPNGGVARLRSPLITGVPVGTPFTLELTTQWYGAAPQGNGDEWTGGGTMGLWPGEVFQLPAGYTLDSGLGNITDNRITPLVPCSGANLLANGDFDSDVSSWSKRYGTNEVYYAWSGSLGFGAVGSLQLGHHLDDGSFGGVVSECVPVSAGPAEVCAMGRIPSGQTTTPQVRVSLLHYDSADCTGTETEVQGGTGTLDDLWVLHEIDSVLPPGAGSARMALMAAKEELVSDSFNSYFDAVHLPEPGAAAGWLAGATLLSALRRRRH